MKAPPPRDEEAALANLFQENGWVVEREPPGISRPDLLVRKGRHAYAVEVKAASEGRSDRVIPLLSQAILQAQAYARAMKGARPLAVVMVGDASESLFARVRRFSENYAPGLAIGVVFRSGARLFLGDGLDELNAVPHLASKKQYHGQISNLFSDLNQWLLKVLLAPEIPERLLAAPRGKIRNASDLASAGEVSVMSASRFVQLLRQESFLDESSSHFKLVRRVELFRRWRAASLRRSREMPMRFLIPGALPKRLKNLVSSYQACLGLFAAAEALHLGRVHGVLPYVYVKSLSVVVGEAWQDLVPPSPGESVQLVSPSPGESAHLILRQAAAPRSVFSGAVLAGGVKVSDVLQIWLDVSEHPSRGREQADLIQQKVLGQVIEGGG